MEFITQSEPLLRIYWYVALFSTLVFAGQLLLSSVGGGDNDHVDPTEDSDSGGSYDWLSFRTFINFLLGLSWAGVGLYPLIGSKPLLLVLSLLAGVGMAWLLLFLTGLLLSLSRDQTQQTSSTATVYLTIPANRAGAGKVLVELGGSTREFDAVTDGEILANGLPVKVEAVLDGPTLLVTSYLPQASS